MRGCRGSPPRGRHSPACWVESASFACLSLPAARAFSAWAVSWSIEARSWQGDERDAKFSGRHGAFWRAAARDPAVAGAMRAALLRVDGAPAAFSFDMETGAVTYAIANSYAVWAAKHSPGKVLYYRNLVRAMDEGTVTVDWGAGDGGYKGVIGATEGPAIRDWLLLRPGLPAAVGRLLAGVWRRSGNPVS